jgi:sugar phosphate isomerase/epimerase
MTAFRLGINNCFAVKRWPEPASWAAIVREELGLDLVQHTLDLVDVDAEESDLRVQASQLRHACEARRLRLHSTLTGVAAYAANLLLHPDPARRNRAVAWYRRVVDFTAAAGARATGGHVGAFSAADWSDRARREDLWRRMSAALDGLSAYARAAGLTSLMIENLGAAREPSSMAAIRSLLSPGSDRHVPIVACLDLGHLAGAGGEETDPYLWLERLSPQSLVVELQQHDGADRHWPFTAEANRAGRIDAQRVLAAIDSSGVPEMTLILKIMHPFEVPDDRVLADLRDSVSYWRDQLAARAG